MCTVSFLTSDVYDHIPRALDMLRKMDFALLKLSVDHKDGACLVALTFERHGTLSSAVFLHRLQLINGLVLSDEQDEVQKVGTLASRRTSSLGGAISEL